MEGMVQEMPRQAHIAGAGILVVFGLVAIAVLVAGSQLLGWSLVGIACGAARLLIR